MQNTNHINIYNQASAIRNITLTQNKHSVKDPGLVTSYDIRPVNRAGLFSKEKIKEK